MMNFSNLKYLVTSGCNVAFVVTGGGASLISSILKVPGSSNFLIEAQVPYNQKALGNYLGYDLSSSCNTDSSKKLAEKAYSRALELGENRKILIGVACTAALKTDRPRKGSDRAHIAIHSEKKCFYRRIELSGSTRELQEHELSDYFLNYLKECISFIQ